VEIPHFLTESQCDKLIKSATGHLINSNVANQTDQKLNILNDKQTRISEQAWIEDKDNSIAKLISKKVAKMTNTDILDQEPLQVVKYKPGGFFSGHYDSFDPEKTKTVPQEAIKYSGYRYATILVYLNDNYTGGETFFPKLNKVVKPEKGKAVIFYNIKNGKINESSYHGGNTVHTGEKWICNKWIQFT
jgi:prolyl 4-hydroxylase